MKPFISINALTKSFATTTGFFRKAQAASVLQEVALDLHKGECLAVVGESGCGKTTLGRCLLRLIEPDRGSILFDGIEITTLSRKALRKLRPRMQMIFQNPSLALNPRQTAGACVAEPLRVHKHLTGAELDSRSRRIFENVGLETDLLIRFPSELSGGQMQRLAIARVLAVEPEFVVADEPTSGLDAAYRRQIFALLKRLQKENGLTLLLIAHDLQLVSQLADRMAIMSQGRIVECAPTAEIFQNPRHPATRRLLQFLHAGAVASSPGEVTVIPTAPLTSDHEHSTPIREQPCDT